MQGFIEEAAAFQAKLVEWRRTLHQNPELGLDLPLTTGFVKQKLEEMGYEPKNVGPGGLSVCAGGKQDGKVILLRADMDALPIEEEADVPCKSTNGNMHACGHDFHTTMLLGAAKLLKAHEDELEGTVRLMFQPAEETLKGAKSMIEHGILEDPRPDAAVMFHVMVGMPMPAGLIVVPGGGAFSAASDAFTIEIQGKGGHGAMPETTVDPLIVASHIHLALQAIRSREIAGAASAVVTVGLIQGGRANNVIPDTAIMKGTIRTFDKEIRAFIPKRIEEIATAVAAGFRAEAKVTIEEGCPSVVNDEAVAGSVRKVLTQAFGPQAVPPVEALGSMKMNGSEDFSFVSEQVPSAMLVLTAGGVTGYEYPVHHPKARFDESVLSKGAAAYAAIGMGWLKENK